MAIYGNSSPNWVSSWVFYGFNTENNIGVNFSMPQAGTITDVVFNCGTINGTGMVGTGGIWNQSGVLQASGSNVVLTNSGQHAGPYTWNDSSGMALAVTNGQALRMGWWRTPSLAAGDCIFGWGAGGSYLLGTTAGSVAIGAFAQDGSALGNLGLYIIYTPAAPPTPPPSPAFTNLPSNTTFVRRLQEEGLLPS